MPQPEKTRTDGHPFLFEVPEPAGWREVPCTDCGQEIYRQTGDDLVCTTCERHPGWFANRIVRAVPDSHECDDCFSSGGIGYACNHVVGDRFVSDGCPFCLDNGHQPGEDLGPVVWASPGVFARVETGAEKITTGDLRAERSKPRKGLANLRDAWDYIPTRCYLIATGGLFVFGLVNLVTAAIR